MTMFANHRKREAEQKELTCFDEQAREDDEEMNDEIFDRRKRLSNLGEGRFTTESDTIFSAILQELKNRKKKE